MGRLLLLIALAGPLFGAGAGAGTYCVTPTGSVPSPNPHNCAAGKTYTQISGALSALGTDQGTTTFTATQTIWVSPGTYTAIGLIGNSPALAPTSTYPLIISSDTGAQAYPGGPQPVVDCGGTSSIVAATFYSPYVTVRGLEITDCKNFFEWGSTGGRNNETISYNYLHANATSIAIENSKPGIGTGTWIHHNIITNVGSAIVGQPGYTIEFNEISATTAGGAIGSNGPSTVRNNILYNLNITNGSGIQGGNSDVDSGNVVYDARYCIQSGATTSPGPTFLRNICVANMWTCHYEAGTNPVFGLMQHSLCYRSTNAGAPTNSGQVQRISTTSPATTAAFQINNIAWPNKAVTQSDLALYSGIMANSMTDYNVWWVTGTIGSEGMASGSPNYASLAAFQATGWDTHSTMTNPRLLGNPDLLATTGQVFPECPNIECRLAKIRRNYMPTNLALKGKGCATWTGSCTRDHSDIGPVPITLYDAPGGVGPGGRAF
jgi:hypothetical protein